MSRKAALPLNREAVRKSDDQFYASHPELVQNGMRIPLDSTDPAQARLRSEWMDYYELNNGKRAATRSKKKPTDTFLSCPLCKPGKGQLAITVVDQNSNPVADATVNAGGMKRQTDKQGVADFGVVDARTYDISASKNGYYAWGGYGAVQLFEDSVEVVSQEKATAKLGLEPCISRRLKSKPFLIAKASESLTPPIQTLPISGSVGGTLQLDFGQDTTHGRGGKPVNGYFIPENEDHLRAKMKVLLNVFARGDTDGKAKREFDAFLSRQSSIQIYTDPKLDKAIEVDENFAAYPDRTLAAPGTKFSNPQNARIHQALEAAFWDINQVKAITDLGPPAFNAGDRFPLKETKDWDNGLAVMIDSVQYVLVFVDQYEYDSCKQQYTITLIFELYDIFGLDDEDIKAYGATGSIFDQPPQEGITAWWQLQHQYDYAPLITKAVVTKKYTVSTK